MRSSRMRFIGDIHAGLGGNLQWYLNTILQCENSIQVGDFGVGFCELPEIEPQHRFIRGNHDNPELCRQHKNWIPDGSIIVHNQTEIFCVGGAYSIDQHSRYEGVGWWKDEELNYASWSEVIDHYEKQLPKVVVTHACPQPLISKLGINNYCEPNVTTNALQVMLEIHRPALWIFGHYHTAVNKKINGTTFICLDKLSYLDITL